MIITNKYIWWKLYIRSEIDSCSIHGSFFMRPWKQPSQFLCFHSIYASLKCKMKTEYEYSCAQGRTKNASYKQH